GTPPAHTIRPRPIAPHRPTQATQPSTTFASTTPLPTVLGTHTPQPNAATKLKKAAHTTAWSGVRTRVETTVAMEFAASWKPLMKSKTSATKTMKTTVVSTARTQTGTVTPS